MHRPSIFLPKKNTLHGTNISHLEKRKLIFKINMVRDMLVPWRVHLTLKKNIHEISRFVSFNHLFSPGIFSSSDLQVGSQAQLPRPMVGMVMMPRSTHHTWCPGVPKKMGCLRHLAAFVIDGGCCKLSPPVVGSIPKLNFKHCQWMAVVTNSCLLTTSC